MSGWLLVIRTAYGAVLLLAPSGALAALTRSQIDRRALRLARILGARELVQAAVIERNPTRGRQLAGAGVDALHAASMLALARIDRRRRRLALHNALTAGLLTGASLAAAARAPVSART